YLPPPSSTLFPYTTLFRSSHLCGRAEGQNSRTSTRVFRASAIAKAPRRPSPFGSPVEAVMAATQVNDLSWLIGGPQGSGVDSSRSEEHTSELQSPCNLVCR